MNLLLIGDIVGDPGRRILSQHLHVLKHEHRIDLAIGNAENAAGGFGVTPKIADELFSMGFDVLTSGNHIWDKKEIIGVGRVVATTASGEKVGILHLMGRVYMPAAMDCPFRIGRREIDKLRTETHVILVDMHGEATSEKSAIGWHFDGEVSAVLGTHTHVQTADEQILPKGTAFLTDVGMTGPFVSVIGVKKDEAITKFLTQMPKRFETATGPAILCGAVVEIDGATGRATAIRRIRITDS
ncbi:MAG: YmdB family metallophosphoesterase [Nitrospirae bacterium]|nr:YmdB family metallophosphoesterase [Nitrospirota bacterium]